MLLCKYKDICKYLIPLLHPAFLQSVHQFVDCRKRSADSSVSDRWNGEQLRLPVPAWLCQSFCQPITPRYSAQFWISALRWHTCLRGTPSISLRQRHPRATGFSLDAHHPSFLIDGRALWVSELALGLCKSTKI